MTWYPGRRLPMAVVHPVTDVPPLPPVPRPLIEPPVTRGMGPEWCGKWTTRPPSNLTEQIWEAHDRQQAAIVSPKGVTGEDDGIVLCVKASSYAPDPTGDSHALL